VLTALRRRQDEEGFTLVEVLVALLLLGLVAAAILPLLVLSGTKAVETRMQTRAKNLAQERIEAIRQLPFQVDYQNGPFIDLLDNYYPNRTAAAGTAAGWVPETGTNRIAGEPTVGSYYRVRVESLTGQPGFRQVVATQFLGFNRTPVPDARFASYRHDVPGLDGAPSTLLGITVLTYWTPPGQPEQVFSTFTQVGDGGGAQGLVTEQASATLLRLESAMGDGAAITSEALSVTADGRLSDGSVSSVRAIGGKATRTGTADLFASSAEAMDPPTCTGSGCPDPQPDALNGSAVSAGSPCGYAGFGRTKGTGVTSTAAEGRPRTPATVGSSRTPAAMTTATLLRESGHSCGAAYFDNISIIDAALGTTDASSQLLLAQSVPSVLIAGDTSTSGNTVVASADVWTNSTSEDAADRFVVAGASLSMPLNTNSIRVLPTQFAPEGVLKVRLVNASITCDSSVSDPVGNYTVSVAYWNGSGYVDLVTGSPTLTPISWSSTSAFTDPYASVNLVTKVVDSATGKTLADYLTGPPVLATAMSEGSTNGVASIADAVLSLTTASTRGVTDPASSIGIKVGKLSCAAVDER
jgi:prepilin-type N-terminal cleavage/methylation domain-containing protein